MKKLSDGTYRRHLRRAQARGNYFLARRDFVIHKVLTRNEAVFVADLINHAAYREEGHLKRADKEAKHPYSVERGGKVYFWCSRTYLHKSLLWTDMEQRKLFKDLKRKGFVETIKSGIPAVRYVYIDTIALEVALDVAVGAKDTHDEEVETDNEGSAQPALLGSWEPGKGGSQEPGNNPLLRRGIKEEKRISRNPEIRLLPNPSGNGKQQMPQDNLPGFATDDKELPIDHKCSRLLKDLGKEMGWSISASRRNWSPHFRLLRKAIDDPSGERVFSVLSAYADGIRNKRITKPRILSGKNFRDRFEWVSETVEKDSVNRVVITDEANHIATDLETYRWPKGSEDKLPLAVQVSLNNFRTAIEKLSKLKEGQPPAVAKRCSPFVVERVMDEMGSAGSFVRRWFGQVFNRIRKWDDWNGDLVREAFSPAGKRFRGVLHQWVRSAAGDGGMTTLRGIEEVLGDGRRR